MNIQIAKEPITETESDQASPDLANEYSLAMQKANHRNCVQSQWGKSVSKKCVQRVCPKSGSPNDNTHPKCMSVYNMTIGDLLICVKNLIFFGRVVLCRPLMI